MAQTAPARPKINTKVSQAAPDQGPRRSAGRGLAGRPARGLARVAGDARRSSRNSGRVVVELGCGVMVYPPEVEGEPWRAVWVENGQRRYR